MKNLLTIFTLLFSTVVFSSPSYADWAKVGENVKGDTSYVDFERIRKVDGYVYFWEVEDIILPNRRDTPNTIESISSKTYIQGDCKLF
jgi:hypothetical protein